MGFRNRTADAQTHAQAVWFGGVEGFEEAFVVFRLNPRRSPARLSTPQACPPVLRVYRVS